MNKPCPFKEGDRIRALGPGIVFHSLTSSEWLTERQVDPSASIATVTKLTDEGFEYRYDRPITVGPARRGMTTTEGTVYPEGYEDWVKVQHE